MASAFTPTVLTISSGGSGGSGSSTTIIQANTFAVGDWVYLNGSTYAKAKADSANTASVVGIVSAASGIQFTLTTSGLVTGLTGLTTGADYFLSATTPGAITTTEPTTTGYVSAPVGIAASATSIQVAIKRGVVIGTSNVFTSISLANTSATTIQNIASFANGEGGVLTGVIKIDATTDYTFGFEISFTKDTSGVINHSIRYFAGDIPTLALFSVGVSGQNIQVTLGAHTGFVNASARFQLSASAISPSLQIDAANITGSSTLQNLTGTQVVGEFLKELTPLHTKNIKAVQRVATYTHGATGLNSTGMPYAYAGGVYSPTQNRIYLVPALQGDQGETVWHYIDCDTGATVAYPKAAGVGDIFDGEPLFMGGVYSPTQNRIYFVPHEWSYQSTWAYIDCNTGNAVAYAHGAVVNFRAYLGGVYSPTQNRIYLVPWGQSNQTNWHYIDCATGSVVAYAHGVTAVVNAYQGGVYSPTQNRIYLVPWGQSNQTNWHYIDCATGSVVAYTHGVTAVSAAYTGGVYSPTQNRIYLVPSSQSNQTNWHYIDCATGSVVAYTHGVTTNDYLGGVYSPTQNRIYFVPHGNSTNPKWHYIASTAQASLAPHYFGSTILSSTL
jgi:hypothetical protein